MMNPMNLTGWLEDCCLVLVALFAIGMVTGLAIPARGRSSCQTNVLSNRLFVWSTLGFFVVGGVLTIATDFAGGLLPLAGGR